MRLIDLNIHRLGMAIMFIAFSSIILPTSSLQPVRSVTFYHLNSARHAPLYASTATESAVLERISKVADKATVNNANQPEPISSTDTLLYGLLATIQLLPPLALVDLPEPLDSIRRPVSYLYFVVTATILVILGAKRQDLKQGPEQKPISLKSAALAPVISSAVIFTIYLLLKYTSIEIYFDRVYQLLGTTLGILSFDSVFTTAGQSIFPEWKPNNKIFAAGPPGDDENPSPPGLVGNSDEGLLAGLSIGVSYLLLSYFGGGIVNPESLFALSFFNNFLASAIAMQAIGTVKVDSFAVACALLSGLFFYDIYWVFFSEVMMTVATKVDAPIKFLFPASLESIPTRSYPFSVLGLGDIVVPGVMAGLARKIDVEGLPSDIPFVVPTISEMTAPSVGSGRAAIVWPNFYTTKEAITEYFRKKNEVAVVVPEPLLIRELRKQQGKVSYLDYVTVGYLVGLLGAFTANEVTRSGQPALLYLVPTVITSMLAAAVKNDEIKGLWGNGLSFSKDSDNKDEKKK